MSDYPPNMLPADDLYTIALITFGIYLNYVLATINYYMSSSAESDWILTAFVGQIAWGVILMNAWWRGAFRA